MSMRMSSQRQAFGETLVKLGQEDRRIVVLEADLGKSTMSCLFQAEFPERYFEMGISEANMTSFAAGLALSGKIAFTNSFAVFAGGRAYDQIRQSICTAQLNVKIHGSSSGLSDFGDGATHQCVEDIAIMRAIPNMTVLVPMDAVEARKAVRAAAFHQGPVYIRTTRNELPEIFPEAVEFEIGKLHVMREGTDVVVFACGVMVWKAIEAAEVLGRDGISVKVVNVSTLKPFNDGLVNSLANGCKGVVTAEEHTVIGGLASAVLYALRGKGYPFEAVAIGDMFGQSGSNHEELLDEYGLTVDSICDAVKKTLGENMEGSK